MAGMQPSGANGTLNGLHAHGASGSRPDTSRPLSFRDSLPYSPQTTTLPFIPDLIPTPVLGSGSPAPSTLDILPVNELDSLNKEAVSQGRLSKHGKQAIEGVLHELKPQQRTQYKFCAVPKRTSLVPQAKSLSDDLSPCAKTLFERVGGYFKGSKSNNTSPKVNGPTKGHLTAKERPSPSTPSNAPRANHANSQAHNANSVRIEVAIPAKRSSVPSEYLDTQQLMLSEPLPDGMTGQQPPTPLQSARPNSTTIEQTPADKRPAFRIEIPSANVDRDKYQEVAETLEEPHNLYRKRERQDIDSSQAFDVESLDQRQRADAALNDLRRRTETINRATRAVFQREPGFDHIVTLNSEQEPTLTGDEQKKMYTAIQKVITLGRFNQVPVEDLSQILRLSEASLKDARSLDIQIDKEWSETTVESWVQQLSSIDAALKAARTSLRILTGGLEDRQLHSESVIEHSVKVFQKVTDEIIVPVVEFRNSGASGNIFKMLVRFKKDVSTIFTSFQKLLAILVELVAKVQLTDLSLNTLEFVSSSLVFVENAHYEKDSLVGLQKFDGIRSAAMDTLCQIFMVKPEQRQGIISEILSSLSKLPVSKQSSRQFKLSEGGSIQPVSALVMRLVQASAASPDKSSESRRANMLRNINGSEEDGPDVPQASKMPAFSSISTESQGADQPEMAIQDANAVLQPLSDDAQRNASLVISFLVHRAAGSSKSGDTPYRNLLDLFVDDFTVCLDSPDWPAAELLLCCLMSSMIVLFEGEKTAAPVKNMALEVLGNLSAAISRLRSHVKKMAGSSESVDSGELSNIITNLAIQTLDKQSRPEQILAWTGPYRVVLESLQSRARKDAHMAGAASFVLTGWAQRLRNSFNNLTDDDEQRDREFGRLAYRLRMMMEDRTWLASQFEFNTVSTSQAKLSYSTMLLGSPLCEAFERMLSILLRSMSSDQATVRSKSLKSVNQVLETDPSILDGDSSVVERILECATDTSTQVRESALSLIGNCIQMRPALEVSLTPHIMERVYDAGVTVRRRAMRLARDIYLRNHDKTVRSDIAVGLLRRIIADMDESVRDAARQMVEEIWFVPFYSMDDTVAFQTSLAEHTTLIIRTAKAPILESTLDKVFQSILRSENKLASGPFSVCSKIVSNMFGFINNQSSDDPNLPSGRDALHVLTILAKAEPKLFTFEQIRLLKPLLASADVTVPEELDAYRSMVVILAAVLPQLSTVHSEFVNELKSLLTPKLAKLGNRRQELNETGACFRVILDLLGNYSAAVSLARSALVGIHKLGQTPSAASNPAPKKNTSARVLDFQEGRKFRAYAALLGTTAQHFDLDPYLDSLKSVFKDFQGDSVARLMVDKLAPFASSDQLPEVRSGAIDGIATVCQAWPRNYTVPKVWALFQQVFHERDQRLEQHVLLSFKEFLFTEERRSEATSKTDGAEKKSLAVMGGTNYDDVASATTQRFLKDITRICLASQDQYALTALEVLGSINRQGLTHPKETGNTLITLETSANKLISELAFKEHKALHEKHESTMEREYTKAVQSAYEYQRDIVKDTRGARLEPPQPKLHNMIEVLKVSRMKNRQRFFEKLCSLIDFDPLKVEASQDMPPHLDFTRFIVENMAFFEYQTNGELQTAVRKLEQIVSGAGAAAAQTIDSEVFNVRVDMNLDAQIQQQLNEGEHHGQAPEMPVPVEPGRLRQLATASIILLLIWETRTYLRRLYGMGTSRHDSKAKALAKDLNRAPTKTQGIHWDKYWDEVSSLPNSLQSQESMIQKCKALVELMNVDSEVKVADEDDDMDVDAPATPSDGDDEEGESRGRKRKNNSTPGGRKKRARSNSQLHKRGRLRKNPAEEAADPEPEVDWF